MYMDIGISFYKGLESNQDGDMITDIWNYTETEYERGHWFIQWMFPSDEPSSINPYGPVVNAQFQHDFRNELQPALQRSFRQFLRFIGVEIDVKGDYKIIDAGRFYLRVQRRNHNLQRITRVLRCLHLLGGPSDAQHFYRFLLHYKDSVNSCTLDYWKRALDAPLGQMNKIEPIV